MTALVKEHWHEIPDVAVGEPPIIPAALVPDSFADSVTFAGPVLLSALPTADPHVADQIWIDDGILTVSAG